MTMPYTLSAPLDGRHPVILASPHSGTHIPPFARQLLRLPPAMLRRIEDAHVDALMAPTAAAIGAPLLAATHSRIVIDLNRAEAEYDPAMIDGTPDTPARHTDRVRRGYGLIPRVAGSAAAIHHGTIPAAELARRIHGLHRPWHAAISDGLAAAVAAHGHALLVDCHSMPRLDGPRPAQLVVGDAHGSTTSAELSNALITRFRAAGLRVAHNLPYAGGHSTRHHANRAFGIHCIQLEFCRTLYMDPATLEPHEGLPKLAALVAGVLATIAADLPDLLGAPSRAMAAE